jgi:glycosyltransferase involved in cell wall biosynthesis
MRICYFGIYDPNYARTRVLIDGLRANGAEVMECNSRLNGVAKYWDLAHQHWRLRKNYDIMLVGFPGYQAMVLAKLLTRKPIVFDEFSPIYDSAVFDRKYVKPGTLKALYYWLLDFVSMSLADMILFDTEEHIKYAVKTFGTSKTKMKRIFVGTHSDSATAAGYKDGSSAAFTVIFFGMYIPLQGVFYIIRAAKLLEKKGIRFLLVGGGQQKKAALELAKELSVENVFFKETMPQEELRTEITKADVCLGIFGDTPKTQRVIPNKVYESLAMRKPLITADSPAIRELFDDTQMMLVPTANPQALADGIMRLRDDKNLAKKLAENGYAQFNRFATPPVLGLELLDSINESVKNRT